MITGNVYDVAVDIRKNCPTFGNWYGEELIADKYLQIYIPSGFAHGFCVLSEIADFVYKCADYYDPKDEGGTNWNDEAIRIQ